MTLADKIAKILSKAKTIEEMINAYHDAGTWLHEKIEQHRKELIEKAQNLPKLNNKNNE